MSEELERVLALCLEAIEQEKLSVEECVERYPQYRTELDQLLQIAVAIRQAPSVQPSKEFMRHSRPRLVRQLKPRSSSLAGVLRAILGRPGQTPRERILLRPSLSSVVTLGLILVLLLVSSVGVVYASDGAVPGDFFYAVDTAAERLRLALTVSREDRVQLKVQMIEERLTEIAELVEGMSSTENILVAIEGYEETIQSVTDELLTMGVSAENSQASELAALLYTSLSVHIQTLETMSDQVSESAKIALDNARSVSEEGKATLEDLFAEGIPEAPSDEKPPGEVPTATSSAGEGQGQESTTTTEPSVPGSPTEVPGTEPAIFGTPTPVELPTEVEIPNATPSPRN